MSYQDTAEAPRHDLTHTSTHIRHDGSLAVPQFATRKTNTSPRTLAPPVAAALHTLQRQQHEIPTVTTSNPPSDRYETKAETKTKMCTQEIVWCACGHGELLPIVCCPQAEASGTCWTVVHGDHRIVLQMKCSHCITQLPAGKKRLGTKARPEGELAARIEEKGEEQIPCGGLEDEMLANAAGELPMELDDVVDTDWSGFDLDPELWQYV